MKYLSFGSVEDLLEDLKAEAPDGGIVRISVSVREQWEKGNPVGLGVASVLITAARYDEVVVAEVLVQQCQLVSPRKPLDEKAGAVADENAANALALLRNQFEAAGFTVRAGAYAIPKDISIYRATSSRIRFENGRVVPREEAP